jgi:diguanylate cyclase (GGDEF)-like protein
VLVAAADRLRSCVRGDDLVARLGGDEFVVLVERLASPDLATQLAVRILNALSEPYQLGEHEVFATPSLGIAVSDQVQLESDPGALLRSADKAMYRAKAAGKGTYALYDPGMRADSTR